ncbi:unnamed protein product [Prunus armeniaca]
MAKHFPPNHRSITCLGVKIRGVSSLKNKRKKKKAQKKVQIPQKDEYEQLARVPITLTEFLPVEFFLSESEVEEYEVDTEVDEINLCSGQSISSADKAQQNEELIPLKPRRREVPLSSSKAKDPKSDTSKAKKSSQSHAIKYDILAHLKGILAPLSVYETLQMSRELREALVMALMSLDLYKSCFKSADVHTTETSKFCASCLVAITFGEDDLLLRSKFHNRPLYVTGEVGGTTISRILLDCGSAVNIVPLKTLHDIRMSVRQLSPSMLTIQGSNQLGQKSMGSIALQMEIRDLYSDTLFHVIDADTSYNVLLGCPCLYTYDVVSSALHQSFKYLVDGEVKNVSADMDSFKGEEVDKEKGVTVKVGKSQKVGAPKPSREPSEKEISSLKQKIESLMTASYIHPLRKINQSILTGSLVISTTFGKNDGLSKRLVVHQKASLPETTSTPLKIKLKGRKAKKSNSGLTVQNESGKLKVSLQRPHLEASEPEVLTNVEQAMFREDEVNTRPLRISVFKCLESRHPPRISIFQRLKNPNNSQQGKVHNKRKW